MAASKNALEDFSAASLALYTQNVASATEKNVPKFTHGLSWTLHELCNYKGFLRVKFSRMWIESKDTRENTYQKKNVYSYSLPTYNRRTYKSLNKNNKYYTENT